MSEQSESAALVDTTGQPSSQDAATSSLDPRFCARCICGRLTEHRYGLRMPARLAQELRDYVAREYCYLPEKWQLRIASDLCLHKVLEYASITFAACCAPCAERIHQRDYPQLDGEPWCIL
ncbi:hypothetical protein [Thermogemmatispora tikiterensis]|uniref:Uncharacterized protein n=1 Tax=Thermogemmatispora tikiterensis TaxID=1825093 RepID=A0A328VNA0_9CHLR|nr:hypothetical protein [Thermogemmatispora tikiterensis]RAQ97672.1 hypothetical protein A4R35_19190 [Thermogemmatispora tikiterensis]